MQSCAQKINADGIDILIDLSGHTAEHRLLTFARKPAPVQASWMGYPGTTGLEAMDYYLTDRYFLPPGKFDSQFTEKLVHLPASGTFLPDKNAPPVNALPALSKGYVTFGSFNRLNKLTPSAIALWSGLLRALPDARMLVGGMPTGRRIRRADRVVCPGGHRSRQGSVFTRAALSLPTWRCIIRWIFAWIRSRTQEGRRPIMHCGWACRRSRWRDRRHPGGRAQRYSAVLGWISSLPTTRRISCRRVWRGPTSSPLWRRCAKA